MPQSQPQIISGPSPIQQLPSQSYIPPPPLPQAGPSVASFQQPLQGPPVSFPAPPPQPQFGAPPAGTRMVCCCFPAPN